MWALDNRTPYAAARTWTRDKAGVHGWVVVIKACFSLSTRGELALADEQVAPRLEPEWYGAPGASSLKYEADVGAMKPSTDLTILGTAYAPQGVPSASVPVMLRTATTEKILVVHGDRFYVPSSLGTSFTKPRPFRSKALRYEDAWGGCDTRDGSRHKHGYDPRNPVGRGYRAHTRDPELAHAVEYAGTRAACDRGPAGFSPIDRAWAPRIEYAGTYDHRWATHKKPLLPDDYDARFELASPEDQRPKGYLRGGEAVELVNLTPEGVLRFALPRVALRFSTRFGSAVEEHPGELTSVVVEPDEKRLQLVWSTSLRVSAHRVEQLDRTTIVEGAT